MHRLILILFLSGFFHPVFSQVFNTGRLLKTGTFSAGINPVIYDAGQNLQSGIFLHAGYGLNKMVDFSLKYGVFEGLDFFGADFEWAIRKTRQLDLSVVTGAHYRYDMGIDGSLCLSFSLRPYIIAFTGVDTDVEFSDKVSYFTWIPVGAEIYLQRRFSAILEADIPVSEFARNIFGGGFVVYF